MKVSYRTTANGTEYWCNKDKKIIFIPAGKDPSFEVTENPESMLCTGEPATSVVEHVINLDGMTATQLREFAEENNIEVPGNLKKPDTIREYIEAQLVADAE